MKDKDRLLGFAPKVKVRAPVPPLSAGVNELVNHRVREMAESRQEKRAKREDARRSLREEVFARKRWSRETTVSWIAYRNKHDLDRPIVHGLFYNDAAPRLVDPDARMSLVEAVAKGRILEFKNDRGEVWYESEQVTAVFPEVGGTAPQHAVSESRRPRMSEAEMRELLPPFIEQLHAKTVKGRRSFSQADANKQAEDHFQKRIDRQTVRTICGEKELVGEAGRPRKIPPKS